MYQITSNIYSLTDVKLIHTQMPIGMANIFTYTWQRVVPKPQKKTFSNHKANILYMD